MKKDHIFWPNGINGINGIKLMRTLILGRMFVCKRKNKLKKNHIFLVEWSCANKRNQ